MKTYSVYSGEYPFDIFVGIILEETAEKALAQAIIDYGQEFPHPVVEEQQYKTMLAH